LLAGPFLGGFRRCGSFLGRLLGFQLAAGPLLVGFAFFLGFPGTLGECVAILGDGYLLSMS
jgi:hypothetical protein